MAHRVWRIHLQSSERTSWEGRSLGWGDGSEKAWDFPYLQNQGNPNASANFPPHSHDDSHRTVTRSHTPLSTNFLKEKFPHESD